MAIRRIEGDNMVLQKGVGLAFFFFFSIKLIVLRSKLKQVDNAVTSFLGHKNVQF